MDEEKSLPNWMAALYIFAESLISTETKIAFRLEKYVRIINLHLKIHNKIMQPPHFADDNDATSLCMFK